MRDHEEHSIDIFNGYFNRGDPENVPVDHFLAANNIRHKGKSVFTRDGIAISQDVGAQAPLQNIRRIYNYPLITQNSLLILSYDPVTDTGHIYHVLNSTTQFGPVLSIVGMTDFAFSPFGGHAFISPFASLPPGFPPPTVGVTATPAAGTGITAGTHSYGVTFFNADGETTVSPLTNTIAAVALTNPSATPLVNNLAPGYVLFTSLTIGGVYRWKITYSTDGNVTETAVSSATAPFTATTSMALYLTTTDTIPTGASVNIYRTINGGSTYYREFALITPGQFADIGARPFLGTTLDDTQLITKPTAPTSNTTSSLQSTLSNISLGPGTTITGRKVYRTVAGGTQLKLLTTINDNTTTTFLDAVADGSLGVNVPTTNTIILDGDSVEKGLPGEFLYIYAGDGTSARKAAGAAIGSGMTVAAGAVGHTDTGLHIYGVVSETASGYLSAPGSLTTFTNVATNSISFGTIPTSGDTNVIKRHIVASIKINNYNGDPEGYDLFFIPNGTINNNTDTFLNNISFFDADLLEDASHLFDNYTEIPAGAVLSTYNGRLILAATYTDINLTLVSTPGEPEAISQITGILATRPNGFPISNAAEFRDALYIFRPNSTISFVDNGDDPSSWTPVNIDGALGARPHSISQFLNSETQNIDYLIIATYQGISLFTGGYQAPELSWKIESYWKSFDRTLFGKIQVVNNAVKKRLYIVMPDRSLLVGFYQNGLNPKDIQWEPWTFVQPINTIAVTDIDEDIIGSDIF